MKYIPEILTVGFAGFGFLIASLAYKTFRDTANAKVLNKSKVTMFYAFLAFSLVLCGMALFSYSYSRPVGLKDPYVISARINDLISNKTGIVASLDKLGNLNPEQRARLRGVQAQLQQIDIDLRRAAEGK